MTSQQLNRIKEETKTAMEEAAVQSEQQLKDKDSEIEGLLEQNQEEREQNKQLQQELVYKQTDLDSVQSLMAKTVFKC